MGRSGGFTQPLFQLKTRFPSGSFDGVIHLTRDLMGRIEERGSIELLEYYEQARLGYAVPDMVNSFMNAALALIMDGYGHDIYNNVTDYEFAGLLRATPGATDLEVAQLFVAKQLIASVRRLDHNEYRLFIEQIIGANSPL